MFTRNLLSVPCLLLIPSTVFSQPKDSADLPIWVKEIFRSRCLECHGGARTLAKLNILDHAALIKNGHVVAGKPDFRATEEIILEQKRGRVAGALLGQFPAQIAIAACAIASITSTPGITGWCGK